MKKLDEKVEKLIVRTSRISFLSNYIIAILAIIFLILLTNIFNLKFSILPKSRSEMASDIIVLGIVIVIIFLIQQPEWARLTQSYVITKDEIIKIEGIFSKRKIILPYQSVSEVTVKKGPFARILNYGDVFVGSFRSGSDITINGIRNAHEIHEFIQNRINLLRRRQLEYFEKEKERRNE